MPCADDERNCEESGKTTKRNDLKERKQFRIPSLFSASFSFYYSFCASPLNFLRIYSCELSQGERAIAYSRSRPCARFASRRTFSFHTIQNLNVTRNASGREMLRRLKLKKRRANCFGWQIRSLAFAFCLSPVWCAQTMAASGCD